MLLEDLKTKTVAHQNKRENLNPTNLHVSINNLWAFHDQIDFVVISSIWSTKLDVCTNFNSAYIHRTIPASSNFEMVIWTCTIYGDAVPLVTAIIKNLDRITSVKKTPNIFIRLWFWHYDKNPDLTSFLVSSFS